MKKLILFASIALTITGVSGTVAAESPPPQPDRLLISEVQTGTTDPKAEFVEIYNPNPHEIDISGWQVDFLTQNHNGTDGPTRVLAVFDSLAVAADSFAVISYEGYLTDAHAYFAGGPASGYLPQSHGTIRLLDDTGTVMDIVGYGAPNHYAGSPAVAPPAGQSISRCFVDDNIAHTDNNAADFILSHTPLPGAGIDCPEAAPEPAANECTGIVISEIGANVDNDQQFIEIHNTTAGPVDLHGCQLRTNRSASASFVFDQTVLAAGAYRAILIKNTPLTLTKTTSGTVYVLSSDGVEAYAQSYANLKADTSWAWFGGTDWRQTYQPTPGAANIWQEFAACPEGQERNPETGKCRNVASSSDPALVPCQPGQERNPATNRCRAVSSASTLTPCQPGQERNPETNRCRNVASASTLVPCKPGQERNPETNRCRSIASTTSTLKPCAPGQERNPETNRCRKVAGANTAALSDIHDIQATTDGNRYRWWIAGAAITAAAAYAAFEWRRDIASLLGRLKTRKTNP